MDEYVFHPLKPQDAGQTWQDLQAAYAQCGGHLKYPSPDALLTSGRRLWTCRLSSTEDVHVLARPTQKGWKLSAVYGGTPRERWACLVRFVGTSTAPPWFCEVALSLAKTTHAHLLTDPADIQAYLPGKALRFLADGRYLREVAGQTVEKVLAVRPPAR